MRGLLANLTCCLALQLLATSSVRAVSLTNLSLSSLSLPDSVFVGAEGEAEWRSNH